MHLLRVGGGGGRLLLAPGEDAQEGLGVEPRRRRPDVVLPHHVSPGRGGGGGAGGYGEQEEQEGGRRGHGSGKGRALLAGSSSSGPHRPLLLGSVWGAAQYACTAGYLLQFDVISGRARTQCGKVSEELWPPGQRTGFSGMFQIGRAHV